MSQQQRIIPAKSLADLYQILDSRQGLSFKNDHVYIPIFDSLIQDLRGRIEIDANVYESYYLFGQTGTGKTTALTFLPNRSIRDKYHIIHIEPMAYIGERQENGHFADILMAVAEHIIQGNEELILTFKEKLRSKYEMLKGDKIITEEGLIPNMDNLLAVGVELFTRYKANQVYRKSFKKTFEIRPDDMVETINEIIEIQRKNFNAKNILLLIDGWEKLNKTDLVKKLFAESLSTLNKIKAKKIILLPIYMRFEDFFRYEFFKDFSFDLSKGSELFKKIIQVRIEQGEELIKEEALTEAVTKSGGNIRQLINIVHEAAFLAMSKKSKTIYKDHIWDSIFNLKQGMQARLSKPGAILKDTLMKVYTHSQPTFTKEESPTFIDCLKSNLVIYTKKSNGDIHYQLNPYIKDNIAEYDGRFA